MAQDTNASQIAEELTSLIAEHCPGMEVEVSHSERWARMCATFRWAGFEGLLPEERFHRLVQVIPDAYRNTKMRDFVWLELTPDESLEAFLALPRSDDLGTRESGVYKRLLKAGFFERLARLMGPAPDKKCTGDFAALRSVLTGMGFDEAQINDAKLLFIHYGAFCDCQALLTVGELLGKKHSGKIDD